MSESRVLVGIEDDLSQPPQNTRALLGKIADLLDRSGINPDEIGRVEKIRVWQGFHKDEDGNAQTVDLAGVVLSPEWAEGPQWPVVQPAAPTVIKPVTIKEEKRDHRVTVILPDPQIGFRRMHDGEMIACHDEQAMNVALQVTRAAKPDHIVNIGDFLDLPEWSSKFLVLPEFVLTTQPTIDTAHQFLAKQRSVAPNAEISLLAGNHDDRLGKAIAKNAMAALRLRRADKPEEWPVLSVPYLLRLEDLNVKYVGGYPAGRVQLTRGGNGITALWAIHGEKLDVAKVAKAERQSFAQGHIHRIAFHTQTYEVASRPETVVAFSPGCLCRVDGVVPSTKGGVDDTGRPVLRYEDWQQGMAVITEHDDGYWSAEIIPINEGKAMWRGKVFVATA
jgi:hypothetical protein